MEIVPWKSASFQIPGREYLIPVSSGMFTLDNEKGVKVVYFAGYFSVWLVKTGIKQVTSKWPS